VVWELLGGHAGSCENGSYRIILCLQTKEPSMKSNSLNLILAVIIIILDALGQSKAQFVYESTHMGGYKTYIHEKHSLGSGKWRFKTKTVSLCGTARAPKCEPTAPIISEWMIADCWNSTIDGEAVPAIARYGYERGLPEYLKSVCRL